MFGISFSEILLICIISLVVLGPKQLPQIATKVGLMIYSIKKYISNIKSEIYYSSGAHEIINTKTELLKAYSNIRNNIQPYNKIEDSETISSIFDINETEFYQPELEFDRQPELFDNIPK